MMKSNILNKRNNKNAKSNIKTKKYRKIIIKKQRKTK